MIPQICIFEDLCLYVYCIVDDLWKDIAPRFVRPGPAPECSDQELIAMTLIGEARGWEMETDMLSYWAQHRSLFPHLPTQSRFNRRRRALAQAFNLIRCAVLNRLDLAADPECVLDSLPVQVMGFHLVPGSATKADWQVWGASYGRVASKKSTIFGYKLHLLLTVSGVIRDFVLASAHEMDLAVGGGLLSEHSNLTVMGDKAYISAPVAEELLLSNNIRLLSLPRSNQKRQLPAQVCRVFNSLRQVVETVNSQLSEQFNIERNHAYTFWGLCTRLYSKLAAHTLFIYINRLLGNADFLHLKKLAFPI
jgi:hypothetical protein